jgi:2-dehydropantoate 2-reductase
MVGADILAEAVTDARVAIWEKFTYLAPFAAFTGAARLPIGPIWADAYCRQLFVEAVEEVVNVARAHGIALPHDQREKIDEYVGKIPPSTRSSLLIDLAQGKRIEVESLQGAVVRRGRAVGVPTPIMSALYAVLKLHASGQASS